MLRKCMQLRWLTSWCNKLKTPSAIFHNHLSIAHSKGRLCPQCRESETRFQEASNALNFHNLSHSGRFPPVFRKNCRVASKISWEALHEYFKLIFCRSSHSRSPHASLEPAISSFSTNIRQNKLMRFKNYIFEHPKTWSYLNIPWNTCW